MSLRVALCQIGSSEDMEENLHRVEEVVSSTDADLFLFPEMFLTRYGNWRLDDYDPASALNTLSEICVEHGVAIAMGMPVKNGNGLRNSLAFITPETRVCYDKLYLANFPPYDEDVFTPGSKPVMVEWRGFRLGLLICYDVMFPEIHRHYAVNGADAVLMASASAMKSETAMCRVLPARSLENTVYTLFCNNTGEGPAGRYFGGSAAYSPLGDTIARASGGDEVLVVTLEKGEIARAREVRHHLRDLRTDIDWC
ncbi:MAG: carbon-nitrogen hydrolase family protein [archaeon]|nr:carbon-nitrogen hydrolase family protein [archaeon]